MCARRNAAAVRRACACADVVRETHTIRRDGQVGGAVDFAARLASCRRDINEKFFNAASEVIGSTPHAFALVIKSELANWGKIIKDGGIRAD